MSWRRGGGIETRANQDAPLYPWGREGDKSKGVIESGDETLHGIKVLRQNGEELPRGKLLAARE
ncbi:MAG: hypothetical protein D6775_15545 [Caldilineae bacterium]|nr:MAG: hypothetical protein D6775_15545 [Caldilineae bacterium]